MPFRNCFLLRVRNFGFDHRKHSDQPRPSTSERSEVVPRLGIITRRPTAGDMSWPTKHCPSQRFVKGTIVPGRSSLGAGRLHSEFCQSVHQTLEMNLGNPQRNELLWKPTHVPRPLTPHE